MRKRVERKSKYTDTAHDGAPYTSKTMRKHLHKARRALIQVAKENGVPQPWNVYLVCPWWVTQWAGAIPIGFTAYGLYRAEKEDRVPEAVYELTNMQVLYGNAMALVCEHDRSYCVAWDLTNPPDRKAEFVVRGPRRGPLLARRGRRRAIR